MKTKLGDPFPMSVKYHRSTLFRRAIGTVHNARGDAFGAPDGYVTRAYVEADGAGARRLGEQQLDPAGASLDFEGIEPEPAQVGFEPREAADPDFPGDRAVEHDVRAPLAPVEGVEGPGILDGDGADLYPDAGWWTLEAGAVEVGRRRVGVDGRVGRPALEPQVPVRRRAERGGGVSPPLVVDRCLVHDLPFSSVSHVAAAGSGAGRGRKALSVRRSLVQAEDLPEQVRECRDEKRDSVSHHAEQGVIERGEAPFPVAAE